MHRFLSTDLKADTFTAIQTYAGSGHQMGPRDWDSKLVPLSPACENVIHSQKMTLHVPKYVYQRAFHGFSKRKHWRRLVPTYQPRTEKSSAHAGSSQRMCRIQGLRLGRWVQGEDGPRAALAQKERASRAHRQGDPGPVGSILRGRRDAGARFERTGHRCNLSTCHPNPASFLGDPACLLSRKPTRRLKVASL